MKEIVRNPDRPSQQLYRRHWMLMLLLGVLMLAALPAFAQLTTADITGTVRE